MWPKTRGQRCWGYKTANVLDKLPKSQQSEAKRALQEILDGRDQEGCARRPRCLWRIWGSSMTRRSVLDQGSRRAAGLLRVPAEHWKHLRTTNVIESSFATIRHRTVRSKGCLSNKTALAMIFKLTEAAEKSWRRLDGHSQLSKVILV